MIVWNEIFRLVLESDYERCLPDGCGLSLPIPGWEGGHTVIRLFACGIPPNGDWISPPYGYFSVSPDKKSVLSYVALEERRGETAAVRTGQLRGNLRLYEMLFEAVMGLAFREVLLAQERTILKRFLRSLEEHTPNQTMFYRSLSPEFFAWAGNSLNEEENKL